MKRSPAAGFTLIELIIVLALIVVAISFATIGIRNYAAYQQYNQAVNDVRTSLQQVRNEARVTVDGVGRGVYITANELTLYVGDTYTLSDPTNVVLSYPFIEFYPNFIGGVVDIQFAPLTGYASASGLVEVVGTEGYIDDTDILINAAGVIE